MVELGMASLGVFTGEGQAAPSPIEDTTDQNEHMVVFKVTTASGTLGLCFHRGQFNSLLARPNADHAVECSLTLEGTHDGRTEPERRPVGPADPAA